MWDEDLEKYEKMSDEELLALVFQNPTVDTLALAVLTKRIYRRSLWMRTLYPC